MKKWIIIIGILLLSISQGERGFDRYLNEVLMRDINPFENYMLTVPLVFVVEFFSGLLNVLDNLWKFLLSWEGVLLIAVIFLYLSTREYLKQTGESDL